MRLPAAAGMRRAQLQLAWLSIVTYAAVAAQDTSREVRWGDSTISEPGRCVQRDTCGRKGGIFGQPIPCVDNSPARKVDDPLRSKLIEVCGSAQDLACCSEDSLDVLQQNLLQAEPLLSLCPAARLNFRNFYCAFTCSPDQSTFLTVTSAQNLSDGVAVASLDWDVDSRFGEGFFDSAKNVKFGATNGYAMDLIGGGAKDWLSFVRYMGQERPGLGSPFQIDFPSPPRKDAPLYIEPLACNSSDPSVRCACLDCPDVCLELPARRSPAQVEVDRCRVGRLPCFSFFVIMCYAVGLIFSILGIGLADVWQRRDDIVNFVQQRRLKHQPSYVSESGHDRVALAEDPMGTDDSSSHRSHSQSSAQSGQSPAASMTRRRLGTGAPVVGDPLSDFQPRTYRLNTILSDAFYTLGLKCSRHSYITCALVLAICGLLNGGWAAFRVEKDPVRLWVAPDSSTAIEKSDFDRNFSPFYRTEQVILTASDGGSALNWDRLQWWLDVEKRVTELDVEGTSLKDLCFSPTATPAITEATCVVQSVSGWLDARTTERTWTSKIDGCAESPAGCLPASGAPLNPKLLLGGIDDGQAWHEARAVIVTWVLQNSNDRDVVERAERWENALPELFVEASEQARDVGLELVYSTGVSLEQELNKSTNTDGPIVVLSYLLMFIYVALNLGGTAVGLWTLLFDAVLRLLRQPRTRARARSNSRASSAVVGSPLQSLLIDSKFLLGLCGIVIVLLSVSTSVGLCSFLGVRVTLIIAEVIPFLVLAIGVDNVFLLTHELDRQNARAFESPGSAAQPRRTFSEADEDVDGLLSVEERVARALARMGPSILLSAGCETVAFALGAIVGMPAVRNFAIYAAVAVFINALLQVTVFIAAMTIDQRRLEARRIDCVPCIQLPFSDVRMAAPRESVIARFIRSTYAPALLQKQVKRVIIALFIGIFVASWVLSQRIPLGLDQRLALPSDSHLVGYFNALDAYLDVGPPVYFVVEGLNTSSRAGQQALCGRFSTCEDRSIANVLEAERKRSDSSFLAEPPAVWLDDFFQWLNPVLESCCRVRRSDPSVFCGPRESDAQCRPCFEDADPPWSISMEGLPEGQDFTRYLEQWLQSPTDESCPLGGSASYGDAVAINSERNIVSASHVRLYHTPLKTQSDFIEALTAARRISDGLSKATGAKVYAYSIFYVFFDQYLSIVSVSRQVIFLVLLAIFLVSSVLLGSWRTGSVLAVTTLMSVTTVMSVMGLWNVSLNAISLVNLVISCGIAVEFCSHVARAFMGANGGGLPYRHALAAKDRDERVWTALSDVGSSVFSGITLTKLIGISVLALTRSKLLEVYYFRMWLALIVSGALHGLVFLPVLLSYYGGQGYSIERDATAEWMQSRIAQGEARPFLGAEAGYDSDEA